MSASESRSLPPRCVLLSHLSLKVHPEVEEMPLMPQDAREALATSIKACGIRQPLIADSKYRVYDGRVRLEIASALGLEDVPVIIRDEEDVVTFAIDSRLNRGQMTRSAKVVFLFLAHPRLRTRRGKKGHPHANNSHEGLPATYTNDNNCHLSVSTTYDEIAKEWGLPRQYFGLVGDILSVATHEQWAEFCRIVAEEERWIGRAWAGAVGKLAAGDERAETQWYQTTFSGELDPVRGLVPRSITSLRNAFGLWNDKKMSGAVMAALENDWKSLVSEMPQRLSEVTVEQLTNRPKARDPKRKAAQRG
jgi:hypothetical protein